MNNLYRKLIIPSVFCVAVLGAAGTLTAAEQASSPIFDNLAPVPDAAVELAYIDPNADFGVYKRVAILKPGVAFRKNWQRDQNRNRARKISSRDMERIKTDVATELERIFTDRLEAAGYQVVKVVAEDVLLLRPAIIDLDITAPDTRSVGRSYEFTASTGAATLYIELYDSLTGQIIGRAADRESVRSNAGRLSWSNSVTNLADARRMFGGWADTLVGFLKRHYNK